MFRSFIWDFISKFSNQVIAFIVSIFLTRLLDPAEFGVVAIAWVVITFSNVFVDLGLGKAIIQAKQVSQGQLSTVFYLNMGIALAIAVLFLVIAAPLSRFYGQPLVEPVLQVLSLSFIFGGLNIVQLALLYRSLRFKAISLITTSAALLSGVVGIIMAMQGYGVWSLVAQNLSLTFLTLVFTGVAAKWKPSFLFDFPDVKPLWHYSSRLFSATILENIYTRLDVFIIGKLFPVSTLGYYGRAQSLDLVVKSISSGSLISVLFPYLSKVQDDIVKTSQYFLRHLHLIAFTTIFITGLMFVNAESIFVLLFTERWLPAAYFFKILAISGFAYPISALMVSVLSARGNSKAYLRVEIQKKLCLTPVYIFGFLLGIEGFLYILVSVQVFCIFLNARFVAMEIGVAVRTQLGVILGYLAGGLLAAGAVMAFQRFAPASSFATMLIIYTALFSGVFLLYNYLTKSTGLMHVFTMAKSILAR